MKKNETAQPFNLQQARENRFLETRTRKQIKQLAENVAKLMKSENPPLK
jgi:hypothetical protein